MVEAAHETWDLWFPEAAARGLPFARGRLRATEALLAHALPEVIDVEVRDDAGAVLARGKKLERTADTPILRLTRQGETVTREDIWPGQGDIGRPVLLPGGETGILKAWWNAPDRQEWRWQVEFYNHR